LHLQNSPVLAIIATSRLNPAPSQHTLFGSMQAKRNNNLRSTLQTKSFNTIASSALGIQYARLAETQLKETQEETSQTAEAFSGHNFNEGEEEKSVQKSDLAEQEKVQGAEQSIKKDEESNEDIEEFTNENAIENETATQEASQNGAFAGNPEKDRNETFGGQCAEMEPEEEVFEEDTTGGQEKSLEQLSETNSETAAADVQKQDEGEEELEAEEENEAEGGVQEYTDGGIQCLSVKDRVGKIYNKISGLKGFKGAKKFGLAGKVSTLARILRNKLVKAQKDGDPEQAEHIKAKLHAAESKEKQASEETASELAPHAETMGKKVFNNDAIKKMLAKEGVNKGLKGAIALIRRNAQLPPKEEPQSEEDAAVQEKGRRRWFPFGLLRARIQAARGGGTLLPQEVRSEMEGVFGQAFGDVRIHTGESSVRLNKMLHARAFTNKTDIHFNRGQYDPSSTSGKKLIAHELAHVVQQRTIPQLAAPSGSGRRARILRTGSRQGGRASW
jgi:hypothetical protein